MSATSFSTHFNVWRLRRLISSIRQVERDVIGEQKSLGLMVERQTEDAQRHRVQEFKELVMDDENERLQCLKVRALKIYQALQATPFGKELLSISGIDTAQLQLVSEARREQVPLSSERSSKKLFGAFQVSWRIVQGTIVVTLLCFGLAAAFSAISTKLPTHLAINLGTLSLALTVIAAVGHSVISLVASLREKKGQPILSLLITCLFEFGFIALCAFFAFQLLKTFVRF